MAKKKNKRLTVLTKKSRYWVTSYPHFPSSPALAARPLHFVVKEFRRCRQQARNRQTEDAHEVGLLVRPGDETDVACRTVVELKRVDVGVHEARNRDDHRHDPDDRDVTQMTTITASTRPALSRRLRGCTITIYLHSLNV